jgi:hypothetical protein
MKTSRFIYTVITLFYMAAHATAQQTIDPTLEVKRDFDTRLMEITKGKLLGNFHDSLGRFNLSFDYSIFDKPIKNLYEFSPLAAATIEHGAAPSFPVLYVKAGSNFPLNPYGELYIRPRTGEKFSLSMGAVHNSFWSKLPNIQLDNGKLEAGEQKNTAPSSTSRFFFDPVFRWKNGELGINAAYEMIASSYYGFNAQYASAFTEASSIRDSMGKKSNVSTVSMYARSRNKNHNSFHYITHFSYTGLNSESNHLTIRESDILTLDELRLVALPPQYDLNTHSPKENTISISLDAGAGFAGHNTLMAGALYQAATPLYSDTLNRSNLQLHPRYTFKKGRWDFELGIKYNRWWEGSNSDYNIYFSGSASLEVVQEKLWIYGFLDGQNNFMTFERMLRINPWISPNINIQNTEQPVIARAGIKGSFLDRFSFNFWGGYEEYRNQLYFYSNPNLFYSTTTPWTGINAFYRDETRFGAGAGLSYHSTIFSGTLNTEYYSFKDDDKHGDKHFNYSPLTIEASGRYNWRERIAISAELLYKSNTPTITNMGILEESIPENLTTAETRGYLRADIALSYSYNKNLSFYLQLNNIFGSTIIEYGTFTMPGFNGGLGISFKL